MESKTLPNCWSDAISLSSLSHIGATSIRPAWWRVEFYALPVVSLVDVDGEVALVKISAARCRVKAAAIKS